MCKWHFNYQPSKKYPTVIERCFVVFCLSLMELTKLDVIISIKWN